MDDDAYERLMNFLVNDEEVESALNEDTVNNLVAEAAALLSDLRASADDFAGAAIWQKIAADAGRRQDDGDQCMTFESWLSMDASRDGHDAP